MSRTWTIPATIFVSPSRARGCSSMVEPLPSKQITRVRFPSSAPALGKPRATRPGAFLSHAHIHGYRTKRVSFMVTFRLFGAEKSVLKLVGANLKDGLNVLVL